MRLLDMIPFALAATASAQLPKPATARIIESLIVAGLSAGASAFLTVSALEAKLDALKNQVTTLEQRVERMRSDLYQPRRWDSLQ
jgi:outer membrane murein-binding lipoprotein Lpp